MAVISVRCPYCTRSYAIDDSIACRKARCKGCGQIFELKPSAERAGVLSPSDVASNWTSGPTSTAPVGSFSPPEMIGRFVVNSRLGSGAFGTVYRATDPLLGREVALKVPRPGVLQDPAAVERFLREARAAAKLEHPNIVAVYETGLDRGEPYIATEFIDGTTLAAAIGPGGIDPRQAAEVVAALAEALHFAHAQGVVHRDVKPANVMLDTQGRPHLMDFGLARIAGAGGDRLTQAGSILGTPAYMAPEQADGGGAEADAASDQYSLGVTLYELLTGKTPFSGAPEVVIYNLTHREIPPPRSLRREIPRDLETIGLTAMARVPAERYADCRELAEDLGRWLRGEPILARRPGNIGTIRRWVGRHRLVAGLAASVLAGLVALGARMAMSSAGTTRAATPVPAPVAQVPGPAVSGPAPARAPDRVASKPMREPARSAEGKPNAGSPRIEPPAPTPLRVAEKPAEKPGEAAPAATLKAAPAPDPDQKLSYEQRIQAAYQACKVDKPERAEALLAGCPAESRGWEWYHCKRLCRFHPIALVGHKGPVYSVAFSPDGKRLASGGADAAVRIWDQQNPAMAPLLGHSQPVTRVAFTADGTRIISASTAAMIEFDVASGKPLRTRRMPIDDLTAVDISVDLKWIAGGTSKGTITVWDATSGMEDFSGKTARSRPIHQVAFSQDAREIAYRTSDGWALLHREAPNQATGKRNQQADAKRGDGVTGMALSPDGHHLAAAAGHIVTIHDASTRRRIGEFPGRSGTVTALAFSHDGKRLAAGRGDVLHLGDTAGSEWNVSLQGHAGPLSEIRFSPDDRRVAASSRDGRVYVWPVTDRPIDKEAGWSVAEGLVEKDAKLPLKRPSRVQFSFAEDGVRILATDGSPYTRLDDGGASLIWSLLALDGEKFDLSASYTNLFSCSLRHNVMVFYDQGRIAVHDVVKGSPLFQTDLNGAMVVVYPNPGLSTWRRPSEFVILSRDRSYAACVGIAGVWDRRTGDWAWTREKGLGMSAFSEKYGLLVGSGSTDPLDLTNGFFPRELVQIYSARTGDKVLELAGGRPFPNCDAFTLHPNGDAIAILRKHEVEIRDLQQYRVLTKFTDFMPEGCSFAPSGGLVAIKGKGVVAIQELTTGRIRCKFDCTSPVVFSPDGARVITAEGGGIVLRDTANGQVLLHLPGPATEFAFSPDGSAIVSVGSRAAKIWVADRPEASPVPNEAGPRRTPQRR